MPSLPQTADTAAPVAEWQVTAEKAAAAAAAASRTERERWRTVHMLASQPGVANAWSFNATDSRRRASEGACLAGRSFYVTDGTRPKPAEMKAIIRAAGGRIVQKPGAIKGGAGGDGRVLVVTTEEERAVWSKLVSKHGGGAEAVAPIRDEHLLSCVLHQRLEIDASHILS